MGWIIMSCVCMAIQCGSTLVKVTTATSMHRRDLTSDV